MEKDFVILKVWKKTRQKIKVYAAKEKMTMTAAMDKLINIAIESEDVKTDGRKPISIDEMKELLLTLKE